MNMNMIYFVRHRGASTFVSDVCNQKPPFFLREKIIITCILHQKICQTHFIFYLSALCTYATITDAISNDVVHNFATITTPSSAPLVK